MSHNELGYTTLSVAEPRRGVSVGASSCRRKKRDGGQCAFRPSEGESPERSVSAAVIRSFQGLSRKIKPRMAFSSDFFLDLTCILLLIFL
jgi:hypothetical protein